MELIDWGGLARGALWIGGLSLALAAWSYAFWSSRERRIPLRQALAEPGFQLALNVGFVGFALGLAWGADAWWERLAWLALAGAFGWQAATNWPRLRKGM